MYDVKQVQNYILPHSYFFRIFFFVFRAFSARVPFQLDHCHFIALEADSPTAAYTYVTYGQLYFPTMQNLFILVHGSILMNHS